jgi:hypothetical protein
MMLQLPLFCADPTCGERAIPADPTTWLGWLSVPSADTEDPHVHGGRRPRHFCSNPCRFAWIDARRHALAVAA